VCLFLFQLGESSYTHVGVPSAIILQQHVVETSNLFCYFPTGNTYSHDVSGGFKDMCHIQKSWGDDAT